MTYLVDTDIELEIVEKPRNINELIYEILLKNKCVKTAEIKSSLRKRDIMVGEHKIRQILNYFIQNKKVFYDTKFRRYCINTS